MPSVSDLYSDADIRHNDVVFRQLRILRGRTNGDERADRGVGGGNVSFVGNCVYRWRHTAVGRNFVDDRGRESEKQASVNGAYIRRYRRGGLAFGDAARGAGDRRIHFRTHRRQTCRFRGGVAGDSS